MGAPFHGDNTGSNPVGDAKQNKALTEVYALFLRHAETTSKPPRSLSSRRIRTLPSFANRALLLPLRLAKSLHNPQLRTTLVLHPGLRIDIHRRLRTRMTKKLLHHLDVFLIGCEERSEGAAKCLPRHALVDSKPLDQRLNVILHDLRQPQRLLAPHRAETRIIGGKHPVLRSLVLALPVPDEQILRRVFIDGNRLG